MVPEVKAWSLFTMNSWPSDEMSLTYMASGPSQPPYVFSLVSIDSPADILIKILDLESPLTTILERCACEKPCSIFVFWCFFCDGVKNCKQIDKRKTLTRFVTKPSSYVAREMWSDEWTVNLFKHLVFYISYALKTQHSIVQYSRSKVVFIISAII